MHITTTWVEGCRCLPQNLHHFPLSSAHCVNEPNKSPPPAFRDFRFLPNHPLRRENRCRSSSAPCWPPRQHIKPPIEEPPAASSLQRITDRSTSTSRPQNSAKHHSSRSTQSIPLPAGTGTGHTEESAGRGAFDRPAGTGAQAPPPAGCAPRSLSLPAPLWKLPLEAPAANRVKGMVPLGLRTTGAGGVLCLDCLLTRFFINKCYSMSGDKILYFGKEKIVCI